MQGKRTEKSGKPAEGYTRVSVIIPKALDKDLEVEAAETNSKKSEIVEGALRPYLAARKKRGFPNV